MPSSEQPHLSQWQQRACRTLDLFPFFWQALKLYKRQSCLSTMGSTVLWCPGTGCSKDEQGKSQSFLHKFTQLGISLALKPPIPGLMQLNDLFPLLIAAWLPAAPCIRLFCRMPGCFPARLQLIHKPLECRNSLSGLPTSHYLALLFAE